MIEARPLPLSQAAQVLGILSIPLAFAGQLVVPAFLMGVIAFSLGRWNANKALKQPHAFTALSAKRCRRAQRTGLVGASIALVLWVLYALAILP